MSVTKDMAISAILAKDPGIAELLLSAGMHCLGCPSAQSETLEEAGFVHGNDVDKLIEDINNYLNAKNK